jgi:glutamine---fructose-6-phosphate transaminase (isomerizing)
MCGIIGYIGYPDKTKNIILDGLSRLEYRGYDSSGLAIINGTSTNLIKSKGKISNLLLHTNRLTLEGSLGIGHTRWATHGVPNKRNAHPHKAGSTSVVHNGIIENYIELKDELLKKGVVFKSETDTEVIAHMVEDKIKQGLDFENSVRQSFVNIKGAYAVALISEKDPDKIIVVKNFSPVILGIGSQENFVASDVPAILPYTKDIIYLEDGDMAIIKKNEIKIKNLEAQEIKRQIVNINWDSGSIEKSGYKHFMLKEIYEQPRSALDTLRGRISEDYNNILLEGLDSKMFSKINRIIALGCGTSFHACLIGKLFIENLSGIQVEADLASEFRYRNPVVHKNSLIIAVSQSGETADTSEAIKEAKRKKARVLSITNVNNSKISRQSDFALYTHAGPEIGVASTKAFTTQLIAFYILAIYIGIHRNKLRRNQILKHIHNIITMPVLLDKVLKLDSAIQQLAKKYSSFGHFIFLGRGLNYPIALEGALKLKEISYIHAEGYAAGEMKHGPIALIDENVPVVIIAPFDDVNFSKTIGNLREIKSRNGLVILITNEGKTNGIEDYIDDLIEIPRCDYFITPIISILPLQLLAYHIAKLKGTDIDQPRNLAKVVTVE